MGLSAEVINGNPLGVLRKPPFRVDAKPGENPIKPRVVNLWISRMIGDEQLLDDSGRLKSWTAWMAEGKPSPQGRFTFMSWRLWKKDDPRVESGLIGPETLRAAKQILQTP